MTGFHIRVRISTALLIALTSSAWSISKQRLWAQQLPTASTVAQISAFAGLTGVETGFQSGRSVAFTAGADLSLRQHFGLNPSLEIRGSFPVDDGSVASQRNLLGGLRLNANYGRFHPYGDILAGRGRIDYSVPALDPQHVYVYVYNSSNVLSPGGGIRFDLTNQFALIVDAQFQRYGTPVSASGHVEATAVTAALAYRFDFNHRRRSRRRP